MTDPPRAHRTDDRPRVPRWVKVTGIVLAVIALLVVLVMLALGGHTPMRHG
jgi:hypothetical protein